MIARLFLVGLLFLSAASAAADGTAQANQLLVEAANMVDAAGKEQETGTQLSLLEHALSKLNEIVQDYPSSALAVKLATGQQIGNISLEIVRQQIMTLSMEVVEGQLKKGDFGVVLEIVKLISPTQVHDVLYEQLVGEFLRSGNFQKASTTAAEISNSSIQDQAFARIARAQIRSNKHDAAVTTAEKISNALVRGRICDRIGTTSQFKCAP